jgi:hypothetical protein
MGSQQIAGVSIFMRVYRRLRSKFPEHLRKTIGLRGDMMATINITGIPLDEEIHTIQALEETHKVMKAKVEGKPRRYRRSTTEATQMTRARTQRRLRRVKELISKHKINN